METFLIKAAQLVLALVLLVTVHEFGHYIFARIFGIRVEKFYLFFNPWFSIVRWNPRKREVKFFTRNEEDLVTTHEPTHKQTWRDTEYGIGWLPLGGYCKIAGMIDESMDKEQMSQPAKPDEFRSRPAYQRLMVMIGGVLFNFLLAVIIYIGIAWHWGDASIPYQKAYAGMNFTPEAQQAGYRNGDVLLTADGRLIDAKESLMNVVEAKEVAVLRGGDTVIIHNPKDFPLQLPNGLFDKTMPYRLPVFIKQTSPGSPAAKAGLKEGDHIIAVAGEQTPSFDMLVPVLMSHDNEAVPVTVVRGGDTLSVTITPEGGKLGFMLMQPSEIYDVEIIKYSLFKAVPKGIVDGSTQMATYVTSLKYIFTRQGAKEIGGFGAIGNLFPAKWNWLTFWQMAAFLSIILAFMNILPIPALDGGHVMFVLWEMVTRRKPSDKFLEHAQMVGMVLLFALLIYANANDIYRLLFK